MGASEKDPAYPMKQDRVYLSRQREEAVTGARLIYLGGGEERDFVVDKDIFLDRNRCISSRWSTEIKSSRRNTGENYKSRKYLLYRRYEFGKWNTCEW